MVLVTAARVAGGKRRLSQGVKSKRGLGCYVVYISRIENGHHRSAIGDSRETGTRSKPCVPAFYDGEEPPSAQ